MVASNCHTRERSGIQQHVAMNEAANSEAVIYLPDEFRWLLTGTGEGSFSLFS